MPYQCILDKIFAKYKTQKVMKVIVNKEGHILFNIENSKSSLLIFAFFTKINSAIAQSNKSW